MHGVTQSSYEYYTENIMHAYVVHSMIGRQCLGHMHHLRYVQVSMNAEKHCVGAKYKTHGTGHMYTHVYTTHLCMYVRMWWESGVHECGNTLSRCHTYVNMV